MTILFKPLRARDTVEKELEILFSKVKSLFVFNKYDGVRCCVQNSIVYGKSLIPHANSYIQELYGKKEYNGYEFELCVLKDGVYDPKTCVYETVSFINSHHSELPHVCVLIDTVPHSDKFKDRFLKLTQIAENNNLFLLPEYKEIDNINDLLIFENSLLTRDNEGLIIRNPELPYREGVSTRDGELLRLKRYIQEEGIILGFTVAKKNNNISVRNALGYLEKSSHKSNFSETQEIATFIVKLIKDVHDPWSKRLLYRKDDVVTISAITISKSERNHIYINQSDYLGRMIKFTTFPKGTKDKPRFAAFHSFVGLSDSPMIG